MRQHRAGPAQQRCHTAGGRRQQQKCHRNRRERPDATARVHTLVDADSESAQLESNSRQADSAMEKAPSISIPPEDILLEIFKQCLPDLSWMSSPNPSDPPVLLTHICPSWRRLAIASPVLWQYLRWDSRIGRCNATKLDIFATLTARAKAAPLRLQVIIRQGTPGPAPATERGAPSSERIPNIPNQLFVPTLTSLTTLLLMGLPIRHIHPLPPGSFPSLSRLILDLEGPDLTSFPWTEAGPIRAFFNSPVLRRVAFGSSSMPREGSSLGDRRYVSQHILLPWEQLTHILDFDPAFGASLIPQHSLNPSSLIYLFARLPQAATGEEGCRARNMEATKMNQLETLTISYDGAESGYPAFIDAYDFPHLKALRLDGMALEFSPPTLWPGYLSERFFKRLRSLGHLTYLSLCFIMVDGESLRRLILATPLLITLDSHIYENYEYFFETIAWDAGFQPLPKLQTLILEMDDSHSLDYSYGSTIDATSFGAFLESRLRPDLPFRKVILYSEREVRMGEDKPFVKVARTYISRGLTLEKRVLKKRCWKADFLWVDRDPGLQDWPGLGEIHFP